MSTVVADIAQATLDEVVAIYATAGVSLPARRLIQTGQPADDCEQVVVWINRLFQGLPADETLLRTRASGALLRSVEINVRIVRCVPHVNDNGTAPNAEAISTASTVIAVDMWLLAAGLTESHLEGDFLVDCQDFAVGPVTPVEWTGGFGGCELAAAVQVQ